jgi:hypothetical protein
MINPLLWFSEREIKTHVPPHFIKCESPLTEKSKLWVITRLQGRYSISVDTGSKEDDNIGNITYLFIDQEHIYFEDPAEATFYELRWSGSK